MPGHRPQSQTRVVVFDFDGTLVDSNAIKRQGFLNLASKYPGGEVLMSEVLSAGGERISILLSFANCMAARGLSLQASELIETYSEEVDAAVAAAPEMNGASGLLVHLQQSGLRLHLSSSTPLPSLIRILQKRQWLEFFRSIQGAPNSKALTLRKICQREKVNPTEVVVVGDGVDDAYAASQVGTEFMPVGSGSFASANPRLPVMALTEIGAHILGARLRSNP